MIENGPPRNCGSSGCLEAIVGLSAALRQFKAGLVLRPWKLPIKDVRAFYGIGVYPEKPTT
jgi:hypothetical protein